MSERFSAEESCVRSWKDEDRNFEDWNVSIHRIKYSV